MGKKLQQALSRAQQAMGRAQQAEKALSDLVDDLLVREDIEYRTEERRIIDQIEGGTIPVHILKSRITQREQVVSTSGLRTLRLSFEYSDPISTAIKSALF